MQGLYIYPLCLTLYGAKLFIIDSLTFNMSIIFEKKQKWRQNLLYHFLISCQARVSPGMVLRIAYTVITTTYTQPYTQQNQYTHSLNLGQILPLASRLQKNSDFIRFDLVQLTFY